MLVFFSRRKAYFVEKILEKLDPEIDLAKSNVALALRTAKHYILSAIEDNVYKCGRWIEHQYDYIITPIVLDDEGNPYTDTYIFYECPICGRTSNKKTAFCRCGVKLD